MNYVQHTLSSYRYNDLQQQHLRAGVAATQPEVDPPTVATEETVLTLNQTNNVLNPY